WWRRRLPVTHRNPLWRSLTSNGALPIIRFAMIGGRDIIPGQGYQGDSVRPRLTELPYHPPEVWAIKFSIVIFKEVSMHLVRGRVYVLAVIALVLALALPGYSQIQTGAITGRATDTSGALIPGVEVSVSSPALIGGAR